MLKKILQGTNISSQEKNTTTSSDFSFPSDTLIYEDSIFFTIYQKTHLQKNKQQMQRFLSFHALSFPTPLCWYKET